MSSSINAYAVSLERLMKVLGSRKQAWIDVIVQGHEDFLSQVDDIDDEAEFSCADAVAGLIHGELPEDIPGYLCGYALEAICAHVGETLSNICPISGASDWIEEVDSLLEVKGIPVRLNELVYGGSPVPIPSPDDYPFIGHWKVTVLGEAKTALKKANWTEIDAEMAETLQQLREWVDEATKQSGMIIVGFLS